MPTCTFDAVWRRALLHGRTWADHMLIWTRPSDGWQLVLLLQLQITHSVHQQNRTTNRLLSRACAGPELYLHEVYNARVAIVTSKCTLMTIGLTWDGRLSAVAGGC